MDRLVIDASLPEKLKNLTHPVELVTEQGHPVAVVQPRLDPTLYEIIGPEISDQELERRCQPGRKTYAAEQVIAMLRKLPSSGLPAHSTSATSAPGAGVV